MTKTLTDKWKNGKLNDGWYYLKVKSELANCPVISECVINYSQLEPYSDFYEYDDSHIEEVLAPVPSYDHFSQLVKKVECLQEQLKEANAIIEDMRPFIQGSMKRETFTRILHYENKWGVK